MDLEATLLDLTPRLLRYCVGRAADPTLGEEIAQETLTALVGRWRRHGPPDSAEAFVFTVARRRLGRALMRRRLAEPLETLFHVRDAAPDPEARALGRDDLAHSLVKLAELPAREREALLLVAGGELDTARAAEVLGISKSALKMRLHRGRKHLQELLEDSTWNPNNATRNRSNATRSATST